MRYVIGVDLGGTQIRAIRCDPTGAIVAEARDDTAAAGGPSEVVHQIERLITRVRGGLPEEAILGVGVGTPGPVDMRTGMVYEAPNLHGWIDVPLRSLVAERTGLHVTVGNDANAAALGEWLFGSGQGTDDFVYVTVSTGIGGGVIVDRSLLLGHKGIAGEVGHMIVQVGGPLCGCGNYGCWEALASGTSLARRAQEAVAAGEQTVLRDLPPEAPISAAAVASAAESGDALALRLMEREGELIGLGIVNVMHLFSPERIALGGGVMNSAALFWPAMERTIQQYAMKAYQDARVGLATLAGRTGVLGAVALVLAGRPGASARPG